MRMVLFGAVRTGLGARTRNGQVADGAGESRVVTTLLISPRVGAGVSTTAYEPGCCGIVGPGPSATLDKTSAGLAEWNQCMAIC